MPGEGLLNWLYHAEFQWNGPILPSSISETPQLRSAIIDFTTHIRFFKRCTQHAQLIFLLQEAEWKAAEPRILILGVGGSIFQTATTWCYPQSRACMLAVYTRTWHYESDELIKLRRHCTTNNAYN